MSQSWVGGKTDHNRGRVLVSPLRLLATTVASREGKYVAFIVNKSEDFPVRPGYSDHHVSLPDFDPCLSGYHINPPGR